MNQQPAPASAPRPMQVQPPVRFSFPASVPYVMYAILGLTVLVYLLQLLSVQLLRSDVLVEWGARVNANIRAGELWRFITPVLLHASLPHILFNMYALYAFGGGLEKYFGHVRFLLLYLIGGFTGNVLSFILSKGYSVGASTAIFGLVAAEGVFLYQNRRLFGSRFGTAIGNVLFIVVVNLIMGLSPGIDNWGHIGGLIGGLMFTWLAGPIWGVRQELSTSGEATALVLTDQREPRQIITGAAMVLLIFGSLAVWGLLTG